MNNPIAERHLVFRSADGVEAATSVQFGRPVKLRQTEWSCEVEIPGVEKKRSIHGVDNLQALRLAIDFVASRLAHLERQGAVFLSSDRKTRIAAADLSAAPSVPS